MTLLPEISFAAVLLAINLIAVGAVLASVVSASFRIVRTAHPRLRYVIAVLAFFLSILLPFWMTFGFSERRETPRIYISVSSESETSAQKPTEQTPLIVESPNPALPETDSIPAENSASYFPELIVTPRFSIGLMSLWLIVSILLLGREILGNVLLARRRCKWKLADSETLNKIEFPVNGAPLYLSESDGPLAVGIYRQAIVFPALLLSELPAESIRSILRHEQNHIRWRDPAVNAVLRITRAIFWFSPALWHLERVARLEREAAADFAAVLSVQDKFEFKTAAADYAKTLILVSQWSSDSIRKRAFGFAATEAGSRSGLENRIRRLFGISEKSARLRLACAALILFSGMFGTLFLPTLSQSFPVAFDDDTIQKIDEHAQFDDSDFISLHITSQTPSEFRVSTNQSQPLHEQKNDSNFSKLLQPESKIEAALTNQAFQDSDEKSLIEAPGSPTSLQANLTAEQQDLIRKFGVTEGYIRELAAVGYKNLPVNTLIDMKKLGVSASFVREMADFGYGKLSSEELIDFRRHGVSATYINEMSAAGYGSLSAKMLIDLRRWAIGAKYAEEMKALFGNNVTAKQLIDLKNQAVSANWVKEFDSLVVNRPSANDAAAMKIHGITVDWVRDLRSLGFENLTVGDLFALRVHGITSPFIEKIKARGIKNPTINELISLRRQEAAD